MSELNIKTNTCEKCGLTSTDHRIFKLDGYASDGVTYMRVVCYSEGACEYRQENHPELIKNLESTLDNCSLCGHTSEYQEFVWNLMKTASICEDSSACIRRCKRNAVLAEMKEMAKKPAVHPVDKFSRAAVLTCGIFMGAVSAFGLSYLLFGV
ncbi:hypothetical protein QCN36_gp44 [Arthrobacter phage CastorTray]|uniref:Uncharacterized protein n=1 Tax=Arthrobacter phage CastorTray TaxID=2859632 RepID=A0AAE7WDQ3_9CAUD|nr:hypothetical protein QCN36_gp44 [Arthrobacter phage CastorTray]QYC55032.1 hypothetical protein SEA_CASTORTRAY_44 [Arthrobacter phage CastorTray]